MKLTAVKVAPVPPRKLNWEPFRKPANGGAVLSWDARAWLCQIPAHSRPVLVSLVLPHVANRLASAWRDEKALEACIEDLLSDTRGGERQGFPQGVREELLTLRAHIRHARAQRRALAAAER